MDQRNWPKKNKRAVIARFKPAEPGQKDRGEASVYLDSTGRVVGGGVSPVTNITLRSSSKKKSEEQEQDETDADGLMYPGEWHLIVCAIKPQEDAIDRSTMTIYVDGVLSSPPSVVDVSTSSLELSSKEIQLFGGGLKSEGLGGSLRTLTMLRGRCWEPDTTRSASNWSRALNTLLSPVPFNRILLHQIEQRQGKEKNVEEEENDKALELVSFNRRSPTMHLRRLGYSRDGSVCLYMTPTSQRAHDMLKYSGDDEKDRLLSKNLRLFRVGDLLSDSFQTYLTMFPPSDKTTTNIKERGSSKLKKKKKEKEGEPEDDQQQPSLQKGEKKSSDSAPAYSPTSPAYSLSSPVYSTTNPSGGFSFGGAAQPAAGGFGAPAVGGGFGAPAAGAGGFGRAPASGGNMFGGDPAPSPTSSALSGSGFGGAEEKKLRSKSDSVGNVRFLLCDLCDPLDTNISLFGNYLVTVDNVMVNDEKKTLLSFWSSSTTAVVASSANIVNDSMKVDNARMFDYNDAYNVIEENSEDERDLATLLAAINDDEDDVKKNKLVSDRLYPVLDAMTNVKDPDKVIELMLGALEINDIVMLMGGDKKELKDKVRQAVDALEGSSSGGS